MKKTETITEVLARARPHLTATRIDRILKDTLRRLNADDEAQSRMFRPRPIPAEVMDRVIDSSRGWRGE